MLVPSTVHLPEGKLALSKFERILISVIMVGTLSLFIDGSVKVGVVIRPFDVITPLSCLLFLSLAVYRGYFRINIATLLCSAYFVIRAFTAKFISFDNFVRESIQSTEVILLAMSFGIFYRFLNWQKWLEVIFLFCGAAIIYLAVYHMSHHVFFMWKSLPAMKVLLTYFCPFMYLWGFRRWNTASVGFFALFGLYLVIAFVSGERKAQIVFVICAGLAFLVGYFRLLPSLAIGICAVVAINAVAMSDQAFSYQLQIFSGKTEVSDLGFADLLRRGADINYHPSNLQREFANRVTMEFVKNRPWFGVGTNGYGAYVLDKYGPYTYDFMLIPIHNEFENAVVETGLVGLGIYLLSWARSFLWIVLFWRRFSPRVLALYGMAYLSLLFQCLFEGTGSRSYVALIILAMLPELFKLAQGYRFTPTHEFKPRSRKVRFVAGRPAAVIAQRRR